MNLYSDHLTINGGVVTIDRIQELEHRDHRPEIEEIKTVPSESQDHAYLVMRVSVLDVPFAKADIAEDRIETHVCSCPAFQFQESAGIESGELKPSEMGKCKHCTVYREERAKQDENQTQL